MLNILVEVPRYYTGDTYARCTICASDFSISHGGRHDVTTHVRGKHHKEMASASTSMRSVATYFRAPTQSVIEAESLWSKFVCKHNLSFQTSDHATKLFRRMFPDSEIAKKFCCGHTKTAAIIKEALAPHYLEKTLHDMLPFFSVMMDESNDKTDKSCIILVRIFDPNVGDVRTRFLDMPIVNIGTAKNLFDALRLSLSKKGLDFSNCISFMSDTTNVMKGARSGVQKLIKMECSDVLDVGCICHLADLTIKAGLQVLPVDIDKLFIDIFYYFYNSSKRKQEFCDLWCSLFTSEPQTILKHCPTRWLSLLRCVGRYLMQLDGLRSYFRSCGEAETSKVKGILERLEHPLTKPLLLFLSFILPQMDRFNRLFQKSTENTTSQLYTEMTRLVRIYASNLLKPEAIIAAGGNLSSLSLASTDQLTNENLGLGDETWACISSLEEEQDVRPLYCAVRKFYVATVIKMLKKFPFGDTILKDLGIIDPLQVRSYSFNTFKSIAQRFRQLHLDDSASLDKFKEELMDFMLSSSDLPDPTFYMSATGEKPQAGAFWYKVGLIKTLDGELRFP